MYMQVYIKDKDERREQMGIRTVYQSRRLLGSLSSEIKWKVLRPQENLSIGSKEASIEGEHYEGNKDNGEPGSP